MQLLTGPPGSGKTFTVLEGLRTALRQKDQEVRLLVPTATMAQHLRNEIAREGFVFRPELIQTLHRFIEPWTADLPQVSEPLFYMLVENSVRRLDPPEFAKVAHLAGFHARLAAVIEECSTAGCDAAWLERHLPATSLSTPLVAVFKDVSRALAERRIGTRSQRLALAASRIQQNGTGAVKMIWLDGFYSLTGPELGLVAAVAKHAAVTVTLPSADVADPTRALLETVGFRNQVLAYPRAAPRRELFAAPVIEREADEIARRIIGAVAGGRLLREIGIIVHNRDVYEALLRPTLERFGIPARFYFDSVLMEHATVRYLAGVMDAMLGGWGHGETLVAMKLAPGLGSSAVMDWFDFAVRKKLPGAGLEPLRQIASQLKPDDNRLLRLLDQFSDLDQWRYLSLQPQQWAGRLASLRALYRPARPHDGVPHETALAWRSQARALDAFDEAITEAARFFDPPGNIPLGEFWKAVKAVLRLMPLRVPDQRRHVVHVMSAHEARQWELAVVFVCGLVEGQFPHYHAPDPFLPDHARRWLRERGFRVQTAGDAEKQERFLFDSAVSRATEVLVLSYPKNDARGEQNLPSLFLDPAEPAVDSRPVRLQPARRPEPVCGIRADDLLAVIRDKHRAARPTALESYLQCPFQFFARHTLKLEGAPPRPEERLDPRVRGKIVHAVIAERLKTGGPVEEIFERVFRDVQERESLPASYKTELWRAQMLADLRRFVERDRWPAGNETLAEEPFCFDLASGLEIRGRIDRLEKTPDGRGFVIDYKYSKKAKDLLGETNRLQGPLYWLTIERAFQLKPAGMLYCSLREGIEYAGWGEKPETAGKAVIEPFTSEWLERAVTRSMDAAARIATGRTTPEPDDVALCWRCEFRDVCRYEAAAAAVTAEGA